MKSYCLRGGTEKRSRRLAPCHSALAPVSAPCHTRGMKRLIYWLAAALLISGVYFTIYAAVQHALRIGANDPQIQLAEDAAGRLGQGLPAGIGGGEAVDVAASLAPFLIVYNPSGDVLVSSARLAGRTPTLPSGVLRDATPDHENRLTWQPQPGVRLASVVVATPQGYVLAGRSLREVERRERDAELVIGAAWLASLGVLAATFLITRLPVFATRPQATVTPGVLPQ